MYRIANITNDGHVELLTRSMHMNGWDKEPVFVRDMPDDPRIITYATKHGALKRCSSLRSSGYHTIVFDAATGLEIAESEEAFHGN